MLARISHSTNRELTVWATESRFRADFVFPVRSDRGTRAGRVLTSTVARLAGGDGRAASACGPIGAVGESVSAQVVSPRRSAAPPVSSGAARLTKIASRRPAFDI